MASSSISFSPHSHFKPSRQTRAQQDGPLNAKVKQACAAAQKRSATKGDGCPLSKKRKYCALSSPSTNCPQLLTAGANKERAIILLQQSVQRSIPIPLNFFSADENVALEGLQIFQILAAGGARFPNAILLKFLEKLRAPQESGKIAVLQAFTAIIEMSHNLPITTFIQSFLRNMSTPATETGAELRLVVAKNAFLSTLYICCRPTLKVCIEDAFGALLPHLLSSSSNVQFEVVVGLTLLMDTGPNLAPATSKALTSGLFSLLQLKNFSLQSCAIKALAHLKAKCPAVTHFAPDLEPTMTKLLKNFCAAENKERMGHMRALTSLMRFSPHVWTSRWSILQARAQVRR